MVRKLMMSLFSFAILAFAAPDAGAQVQGTEAQRNRANQYAVGIISGGINGTYVRIAADLAAVLDDGDNLRVLPMMGKGSVQNINDILYLRGTDIGIVQSDVLAYMKRQNIHPGIERRIHYITKLYNEEIHILARDEVREVAELAGRKVNFDNRGSGTFMTATTVFDALGIKVEATTFDQALALEKLKSGEISALLYVAGKPTALFRDLKRGDGVHLLAMPQSTKLLETYLPSNFTSEDYAQLVPEGQRVETLAVGSVMAAFAWEVGSERYQRVARFVEAFLGKFEEFRKPPRHAKWQEVSLTAQVPGWTRFRAADEWLRRSAVATTDQPQIDPKLRKAFETFLQREGRSMVGANLSTEQKETLFLQFVRWQNAQHN
jgi:TRAP transporter TAXI family solute receptor